MKHTSVSLGSPIEFINTEAISPFISKCQIKVCYVSDEPNRNRSIITKDVAREMAHSLRGSPIVGFYNKDKDDFEEHNKTIKISSNGEWEISDDTFPYGFVDLNAKIWFEKFLDDNETEREYLVTEGYIWDHVYPEAKRILESGNNQSMELDDKTLNGFWTKNDKGIPEFFIINEALITKLCILGEENEPCFEGAQITKVEFSFNESFQNKLFSMMEELTKLIEEGREKKVPTIYAIEIGSNLWEALYSHLRTTYPDLNEPWTSLYSIKGLFEEEGAKFAILIEKASGKLFRLNFDYNTTEGFSSSGELILVEENFVDLSVEQFSEEAINEYVQKIKDNFEQETTEKNQESIEQPTIAYSLEEIPEYVSLQINYSTLETTNQELMERISVLEQENADLKEFKLAAERADKEAMIAKFYMLSDEDKADVITNIDTYSLDDIEAKLSVICVRNKISFADENEDCDDSNPTVYCLDDIPDDNITPAWVKAALNVAKKLN